MNETTRSQAEGLQFLTNYRSAFTTRSDGSSWPKFKRTWHNAARYFRGLLRPGSPNTITDIAEKMHADQERLERFVRESPWSHENVEAELRERVPEAIQGHDAALVIDGMPIPKSGEEIVGVVRQWCSVTGKVDTCQMTVNCTLASPGERQNADQLTWPLGMRLYLPKKWTDAPDAEYDDQHERELFAQRREDADLPTDIEHQTKLEIAQELVEEIASTDVDHGCVVADSRYGEARSFRQKLRDLDEPYLLDVPTGEFQFVPEDTELLHPEDQPARKHRAYPEEVSAKTPEEVADEIGDDDWTEVTWNEGTKETMSGEFYRTRIRTVTRKSNRWVSDETGWLLLKKNHGGSGADEEGELKAWVCWGVDEESLEQLVSWSQSRWSIEQFHRDIKQNLGADEYQGRTWKGVHHHLAVVMLAHAFVVRRRLETGTNQTDFSSFEEVINDIVHESAVQGLMEDKGCDRARAEELAEYMLQGYSPW
jgi:SRSO17 transposase